VLETALLNMLNFQTLIATKTSRIVQSAQGGTVLEFGLRRAQGEGGNAGTRAALIGGAAFSSNAGASHELGVPPKGTHAHSMVQAFIAAGGTELDAFRAYAEVYPDDCLLLVDTVDTLESGIPNAIHVFEELSARGHKPVGIRLDSGDLAYLSIRAARMLDDAGFDDAIIVLSNQLDELVIWQILSQIREEARRHGVEPDALIKRLTYGVGTRLITSSGSPALDGVYKLVRMKSGGRWEPAIKVSEVPAKTITPGDKQVRRIYDLDGNAVTDFVALRSEDPAKEVVLEEHHPHDTSVSRTTHRDEIGSMESLHREVLDNGTLTYEFPDLQSIREARQRDLERLHPGVRRIVNPHTYHVSLSRALWDLKRELVASVG
jgi:nicotinate phosphoribosyltransferase